jgi:hypothetical protein
VANAVSSWWQGNPTALPTDDELRDWVLEASAAITDLAEKNTLHPRVFACTLVVAVVSELGGIYLQVGDGAIVIKDEQQYVPIFWSDETEALNLTHFITDEQWSEALKVRTTPYRPEELALFSDGLQLLVLDFAARSAHSPFFEKLFAQVRACPLDQIALLDSSLSTYLDSPVINAKTDDDKTLVLAVNIPT